MCKIVLIPGIKEKNVKNAWKFAQAITPLLTSRDSHGFGYAAMGNTGIFGERWVNVKNAWKQKTEYAPELENVLNNYCGALIGTGSYNKFGNPDYGSITALMLHARYATCDVNINNTHPFVLDNVAMVHNGVISNHAQFKKTVSTCDSEAIIKLYTQEKVDDIANNFQDVADQLNGWYACGFLTDKYFDIVKDNHTSLFAAFIKELDTVVFCTSKEIMIATVAKLKWKNIEVFEVEKNVLIRHDVKTGQVIEVIKFEQFEREFISEREWQSGRKDYVSKKYVTYSDLNNDDGPVMIESKYKHGLE